VVGVRSDGLALTDPYPLGVTMIAWTATDGGSSASCTQTITVQGTASAPVITVNGSNPLTLECHTPFTDPGATATACAGSGPVIPSGSLDPTTPGTYTLTYTATNSIGTATATRTVNVVDTTKPVITLTGSNTMTVECHGSFSDPGATASDACAGNLPAPA